MFLPTVVCAASLVRFTFVAMVLTLCAAAALSASSQRKYIVVVILVIVAGVGAGQLWRHDKAAIMAAYLTENPAVTAAGTPSCSMDVNPDNSIAIRQALFRDAIHLIPSAGLIGLGLDSFMTISCMKKTEVHNSILQATVEFGWLGCVSLALLISFSIWRLLRRDGHARFVLYGLLYVTLESMAHGWISRDALLFAFLGLSQANLLKKPHEQIA